MTLDQRISEWDNSVWSWCRWMERDRESRCEAVEYQHGTAHCMFLPNLHQSRMDQWYSVHDRWGWLDRRETWNERCWARSNSAWPGTLDHPRWAVGIRKFVWETWWDASMRWRVGHGANLMSIREAELEDRRKRQPVDLTEQKHYRCSERFGFWTARSHWVRVQSEVNGSREKDSRRLWW